jgi:iron complex outermembrane recepter protein
VNIIAYLKEYLPVLRNPVWQSAAVTAGGLTVADRVARIQTTLDNFVATRLLPEDIYAPSWSVNVIQTYSFARESRLGGFSVGGSINARGKSIAGFGEAKTDIFDPDLRYYAPAFENFGAWITYQRKLFTNRVDWRLQLNVRNVFDAYKVYLNRAVDARDGKHTQANVIYRLNEPRTYALTSTFKF